MTFDDVKKYLREAPSNFIARDSKPYKEFLTSAKAQAVAVNDQALAKSIWCFEEILDIQDKYIESFFQLKAEQFYDGWCTLEQVEIGLHYLIRHYQDTTDEFHVDFISKHISQCQSIYPYNIFLSPEIVEIEKKCNICKNVVSIRNSCGHHVGEIYDGQMCLRIVTEVKLLGMGFVRDPVQKYSVPFLSSSTGDSKRDHYNYSIVNYLIKRLESPFYGWDVEWATRRHPHSRFSHIGRNDPCPCESGKKYKKCCLLEEGVLRPHCQFTFHVTPPRHLLTTEYSD